MTMPPNIAYMWLTPKSPAQICPLQFRIIYPIASICPIDIKFTMSKTDLISPPKPFLLLVTPPTPSKNVIISYQVAKVKNLTNTLRSSYVINIF